MNRNILATILLILAVGVYFTVTENFLDKAKEVQEVNAEYKSALDSAKKLISVRDQVLRDFNQLSATDKDRLDKMIPNSIDNIRLIVDINDVALKHGFSLQSVKATVSTPPEGSASASQPYIPGGGLDSGRPALSLAMPILDTATVSFTATAPYLEFLGFLQDIEASLRLLEVTELTVDAKDSGLYTYSVTLQTYWLRQQ